MLKHTPKIFLIKDTFKYCSKTHFAPKLISFRLCLKLKKVQEEEKDKDEFTQWIIG